MERAAVVVVVVVVDLKLVHCRDGRLPTVAQHHRSNCRLHRLQLPPDLKDKKLKLKK